MYTDLFALLVYFLEYVILFFDDNVVEEYK